MAEFHQSQYSTNVKIVQVQWKSYIILHEMLASWLGAVLMADRKLMQTSLLIYINKHALSCPAVEQKALAFLFWALIWGPFFLYMHVSQSLCSHGMQQWQFVVIGCLEIKRRSILFGVYMKKFKLWHNLHIWIIFALDSLEMPCQHASIHVFLIETIQWVVILTES